MSELFQFVFRMVTGGIYVLLEIAFPKWQEWMEERRRPKLVGPALWGLYEETSKSLPHLKDSRARVQAAKR